MSSTSLLEGKPLTIGGREFTVPPLSFKQVKAIMPLLKKSLEPPQQEEGQDAFTAIESYMEEVAQVVHMALTRNYPDLTLDEVENLLDVANAPGALRTVLEASGFTPGEPKPGVGES